MLAIVLDSIDNRPFSFARLARVECKHGAYHETFDVHCQMILQVRDALHRPVCVDIPVTLVSSTVDAVKGISRGGRDSAHFPSALPAVPCFRYRKNVLLTNSPGISTVSMCTTSRYISLAKCIRPDDALRILLEYESTRFLMASRNFSLYGSLICLRRQVPKLALYVRPSDRYFG